MGLIDKLIGGVGSIAEGICDGLGLPEAVGDIASGATNFFTGNFAGLIQDGLDLGENVMSGLQGGSFTDPGAPPSRGGGGGGVGGGGGGGGGGVGGPGGGGGAGGAQFLDPHLAQQMEASGMDLSKLSKEDAARMNLQKEMTDYKNMVELLSTLMKMQADMQSTIIRNI
jgi:hypothetical protein